MSDETRSGLHPVNIAHLVMGLVLLGLVGIWALVEGDVVAHDDLRWLLPIPWVIAGVVGLAATAITGTRRYAVRSSGWVGVSEPAASAADEPDLETETQEQQ